MKFKKLMAAVTTGVLAVTSLSLSGLIGSAEVQELMNDTFESGYGAWKGVGSSLSLSTEQAHNGGTSLYCYDRTANWGAPRCSLTGIVAAGQSYEISASAMYEGSGQQNMAIKMIYTDANGTDHYDQVAAAQATAGQWVEIKGNYTVPSGATDMILYVEMPSANTDQTYYIDDVVIKGEKTEIQLDDKFESDFDNNSTQKWNGRGSAKVELSTKYAHSGTTSLYVSGRTQLWNGATRSLSDIMEAGGYYKVGTYVLYDGDQYSDTQKFSINLQYDLNGKENYYTIATETANKGEWKYVGSEFTVPEGATNFYTYVQTGYTSAPKEQDLMNFYMDDAVGEHLPDPAIQDDIASLKDAYSDYFKIGCSCTGSEFAQGATKDLIKKHYNSLTLGNELKPDSVLDQALSQKYVAETGDDTMPQISLNEADEILKFAGENKIPVRGHVLVWHSQTPDWFFKEGFQDDGDWVSKDVMLQRMENYIKNVFAALEEEYPTVNFYAWDVVNEAWLDNGVPRTGGGQSENANYSGWVKVFGDNSFIEPAFEYARKYAPANTKLYYNDFNEYMPQKTDAICKMALELKDKGLIDGIGMQSHLDVGFPNVSTYKKALEKFVETGLDIQVTELDITTSDTSEAGFEKQAEIYKGIMDACVEYADSISAVVFWGTTDDKSWRAAKTPLLFNENYTAKPSFYAIVEGKDPVVTTETTAETTTTTTTTTTVTEPVGNVIRGDVNEDGMLNGFDLAIMRDMLFKEVALVPSETDPNFQRADMNADGSFNIQDAVTLMKFLLG